MSWFAFCQQPEHQSTDYQSTEEYICVFRGPLVSFFHSFSHWWGGVFDKPDAYVALFTAVLAISTYALWTVTKASVEIGNREFISTHRPKIRVKHLWLVEDIWQAQPITVNLTCVNTGTADAILGQIGIRCHVIGNERMLPADPGIAATIYLNGEPVPEICTGR
jgi:hypothetical protein